MAPEKLALLGLKVNSITNMINFSNTGILLIPVLIIRTVSSCGVMPSGQMSTRNFTVTVFTLPVSMVYSGEADVCAKVFDVLEQQGRSALLPDAIISSILGQLRVQVSYEPLECKGVAIDAQVGMRSKLSFSTIST
ncbi:hypothetical protein KIN20_005372 [Parelaphostrongylus tenuis]|uniref:Uncharacterized protein n=1 Tax=Parelaphostrongylus tenuis TaxID=148309 RepID=A0AAD5M347_PARTN|nr:hypothetical protein KIN20_005372 [Parelaphostrongylus tenuis]